MHGEIVCACLHTDCIFEHDGNSENGPNDIGAKNVIRCSEEYKQRHKKHSQPYFQRELHSVAIFFGKFRNFQHPSIKGEASSSIAGFLASLVKLFDFGHGRRDVDANLNITTLFSIHSPMQQYSLPQLWFKVLLL